MSSWYALEGSVKVKACEEAKEIVERYSDEGGEMTADYHDHGDGTATVEFSGGTFLSDPSEMDDIAKELQPFALEAAFLSWDHDHNEMGRLYVGPPDQEAKAKSADSLAEIRGLLEHLTQEDKAELKAML